MPTKKVIVETSAIRAALNETNSDHHAHFKLQVGDAVLHSSVYIRMEFVRAFIKPFIEVAFRVDHFGNVDDALGELEEEFGIRKVKLGLNIVRSVLREIGTLGNQKAISKEIGRLAVLKLKLFDRAFRSRINNASGCRIGGKQLVVDFNRLFECLREFMESTANVNDCPINDFLGFSSPHGRSQALLSHSGAASTKAGVNLLKLAEKKKHVDCGRCSRIGDAVIAMEQSKAFVLAHIDESFESLCEATGREHVPIKSARACASDGGPTSG